MHTIKETIDLNYNMDGAAWAKSFMERFGSRPPEINEDDCDLCEPDFDDEPGESCENCGMDIEPWSLSNLCDQCEWWRDQQ